jgi:homoserine dehydrogenase
MKTYRLALIGFGNVGQGLAMIISQRGEWLKQNAGLALTIVAVSDLLKGSVYDPNGLDPKALLDAVRANGRVDGVPGAAHGWDALRTITEADADVVVELSYTDLKTGEPAIAHLKRAIEAGRHVVTTNKGPIALRYPELKALADAKGVYIGVEGP